MLHIGGHRNTAGVDCFFYLIPQVAPYHLDGPKGTHLTMHFSSLFLKVEDRAKKSYFFVGLIFQDLLILKPIDVHSKHIFSKRCHETVYCY